MYVLEQRGFRKLLDTTFMVAFLVSGAALPEDVERYVSALVHAQRDIDEQPQRYKHYHLKELPEHLHPTIDVRGFGLGERIVAEPYTRSVYERTQRWMIDAGVLPLEPSGLRPYEEAVLA
jgi:hypothetical protein